MDFDHKQQGKQDESALMKAAKDSGLLQSEELYQYLLQTSVYPREAASLKELRDATKNHPKSFMAGAPLAGQLISFILKKENAKKTIEVGVFTGYSLLLTALSIPQNGKITAIDVDKKAYDEYGLPYIKKAGVEDKITFVESNAVLALDNILQNEVWTLLLWMQTSLTTEITMKGC